MDAVRRVMLDMLTYAPIAIIMVAGGAPDWMLVVMPFAVDISDSLRKSIRS